MSTITSDTIVYQGFNITPTYQSSATRRTCSTIQGYIVTHPKGGDKSPCGWRTSIKGARKDIDKCAFDSKFCADEIAASDWSDGYLECLSRWFPSSAAADAIEIRRKQDEESRVKAIAAAIERAKLDRIRDAAPDMLAALKRLKDMLDRDDEPAQTAIDFAIAKAEGVQS
jgi:hypothetical protein